MVLTRSPLFFYFLFLLGICAVWSLVLQVSPDKASPWNYGYTFIYGTIFTSGAIIGVANGIKFGIRSTVGKTLVSLGLGLFSWQIGLWVWLYYNLVLNIEVPFPSVADFFFVIAFYPLLIFGCFNLLKLYTPKFTARIKIEALIITILSLVVVSGFIIKPDVSPDISFFLKLDLIVFSFGDAILIAIALISLRVGGLRIHSSLLILAIGFFVQFAADYVFTNRSNTGIYWNGDIADVLYTLAGFVMSLGILEVVQSLNVRSSTIPATSP